MPDTKISADYTVNPFAWSGTEILPGIKAGANGAGLVSSLQTYFATLKTAQNEAPQVIIASAASVAIGAASANSISISGTVTITSFDAIASGAVRRLLFTAALTLTHNATTLILPSGANIITVAGDVALLESLGAGNWRCVGYQRASGAAVIAAGGGLTNFNEAVDAVSATNSGIPVASVTANNAAASVDIALVPKGNQGGLAAAVADSTSIGGNKRGPRAVDWQMQRTNSANVASGSRSVIGGGQDNQASGMNATIGGGSTNVVTSSPGTVSGGESNTVSGINGTVCGGKNNTNNSNNATILGGYWSTTRGIDNVAVFGSGATSSGDTQSATYIQSCVTNDATQTVLTSSGSAPSTTNTIVVANGAVYTFRAKITAKNGANGDSAGFEIRGVIKRALGTLAIVGTPIVTAWADVGASAWAVTAFANTTNQSLEIKVTGVAAISIRWTAAVQTMEGI